MLYYRYSFLPFLYAAIHSFSNAIVKFSLLLTFFLDPLSTLGACDFLHNMPSKVQILFNVGIVSKF